MKDIKKKILKKPSWIKVKLPYSFVNVNYIKDSVRDRGLKTICEEALCPNLYECYNNKTLTFIIMGSICTRRCSFCNVSYGRPGSLDDNEPKRISKFVYDMKLNHVVLTSVNRDDLHDGGAQHFINCIKELRFISPSVSIEILVPDFNRCMKRSIEIISSLPPDIFGHNIETVPSLYKIIRPHANYKMSLRLLNFFKEKNPNVWVKSGMMLGLGETNKEVINVIKDLYVNGVDILTIGQYLQPSKDHFPVHRYVSLLEFKKFELEALSIGFKYVFCSPLVRSSYRSREFINKLSS